MSLPLDVTGSIFGCLTAIRLSHRSKNRISFWRCRCSCGVELVVALNNLRSGNSTTCGCRHGIKIDSPIKHEQLLKLLDYYPETGLFTWKVRTRSSSVGDVAGNFNVERGYIVIGLGGQQYYAHVLAWFFQTKKWPLAEIDHEDLDGINNRWNNLRPASHGENACNGRKRAHNKSGFKGVVKQGNRYFAKITAGKVVHQLGAFASAVEAAERYDAAALKLHGKFARLNFEIRA